MYLGQAMGICPGLMNFQTFDTFGTPYPTYTTTMGSGYPKPEFRVTRSFSISYLVGPLSLLKDTLHQNSQHSSTHLCVCV